MSVLPGVAEMNDDRSFFDELAKLRLDPRGGAAIFCVWPDR